MPSSQRSGAHPIVSWPRVGSALRERAPLGASRAEDRRSRWPDGEGSHWAHANVCIACWDALISQGTNAYALGVHAKVCVELGRTAATVLTPCRHRPWGSFRCQPPASIPRPAFTSSPGVARTPTLRSSAVSAAATPRPRPSAAGLSATARSITLTPATAATTASRPVVLGVGVAPGLLATIESGSLSDRSGNSTSARGAAQRAGSCIWWWTRPPRNLRSTVGSAVCWWSTG